MKLDLENDGVFEVEITREVARKYFDGEPLGDDFETALDEAQAFADGAVAYLVLKVR